jgi:myo-inositol 2-dehydrogenase / D-chiro-inositol 1-dehydrogenase
VGVTKTWQVGIIGCGWAGEQHVRALETLTKRARVVAVADDAPGVAEARAQAWRVPRWTRNYQDVLSDGAIDAVSVCLPHHLHAAVSIEAAESGQHVLVEKPLANTLDEADRMIAAADAAGKVLMVAENVRFEAQYQKAADVMREGVLGDVFLLRISREHQMHAYLRARPWFLREPSAGITYSGGVHDFELLRMLGGEIDRVYAVRAPKVLSEMAGEDTVVAVADLASGAKAVLTESFSIRTPFPGVHGEVFGSNGSLWFYGDELRIYTAERDGQPDSLQRILTAADAHRDATMAHPSDTFVAEWSHFLDCLDGAEAVPITSGREARKPLAAVLAAYRSMELGRPVAIRELEA